MSTLEVDVDEPRVEGYFETEPDMMNQEHTLEEFAATSTAVAVRGPSQDVSRKDISRAERERKIIERYGVPYDDVSDIFPGQDDQDVGVRVRSRVRMRVRYSCHVCNATLLHEGACRQCLHARCDACPRKKANERAQEL